MGFGRIVYGAMKAAEAMSRVATNVKQDRKKYPGSSNKARQARYKKYVVNSVRKTYSRKQKAKAAQKKKPAPTWEQYLKKMNSAVPSASHKKMQSEYQRFQADRKAESLAAKKKVTEEKEKAAILAQAKEREASRKEFEKWKNKEMKAPISNAYYNKLKNSDFDKEYDRAKRLKAKNAAEKLNKKLAQMGAKGLIAQQKEVKESNKEINKKAKAYREKNKSQLLTTDEMLRRQFAEANPTYRAKKGGDKVITEDLQEKIRANIQSGLDRGSAVEGFLRGSMPVADLNKIIEKKYGIKLDDTRAKQKVGYNIGEAAGYLFKSGIFGGASEAAIAKGLTKTILKKTGKQSLGKAGKFGVNRTAEVAASMPINVEDAAKNSKNKEEFAKNLGVNVLLDAGLGSALDAGRAAAKVAGDKTINKLLIKMDSNVSLTNAEKKSLQKRVTKVASKQVVGKELTEVEKRLAAKMRSGEVPKIFKEKNAHSLPNSDVKALKQQSVETIRPETKVTIEESGVKAGRITKIKEPYTGKVPEQKKAQRTTVEVKPVSVKNAQRNIDEANGDKKLLKKAYEAAFSEEGGARTRTIKDMTYDGKPYDVYLGKKAVGKVVSDPNMSPEKLAVFDNIDQIIEDAEYVGSGNYVQHGAKQKLTERYDYFETEIKIGKGVDSKNYIVSFDVEVYPNTNNYRTHKITKIDLTPASDAGVGPVPTAKEADASLHNDIIQDNSQKIKPEASVGNKKSTYLKESDVSPEYKKTYDEFVDSVDDEIVEYVSRAKAGVVEKKERHKFGGIKRDEAAKIETLTGKDVDGYTHSIGTNDLEHIEKRHGINGQADSTMADANDIGRIRYVIENYDNIRRTVDDNGIPQTTNAYLDKNMKPAPLITYEKRVDGHVYVVEAMTDTSKKEVRVLSAYMNTAKKNKAPYTANANTLASTSDNAYTDASIDNIPDNSQKIKTEADTPVSTPQNASVRDSVDGSVTDSSQKNNAGLSKQKYTGVRIRSNITKKEYNIPRKKELDIRKNNDGSIEVSGKPLQEVDRKDLRGFVKKYAEKNYLSRFDDKGNLIEMKPIVIESDRKQVIITKKGINDVAEKIKGGKKSVDYSESLLALDDIIERAIKVDESPNLKGRENPYSYYESVFRTNNIPYKVHLRIKDTPDISRYHYHTLAKMGEIEIQKIEPLDGTYTLKGDENLIQADSTINNSIPDTSQNINIEEPKVGDKVDNAAIEAANKNDSEAIIDLENDPAVRDIVADPRNKEKSSGSLKQSLVKMKDEFRQVFVDSLQGIEVAAKKVGGEAGERLNHQANALRQAGEKANYSITTKQIDFNMQVIGKGEIEILAPIMKRGKDIYSDFNAYLFHRLNINRFKNGKSLWGEDVIPQEKSRQIISQLDDKYGDFSEAAEEVYQYFRNLNTVRVQSGMISTGTKNMLEEMYENYVPAYRNINKSALEETVNGSIKVNTGIRRVKGGNQAILPIEKQMAYATQQAWKAAELNRTIKTLAEVQGYEIKEIMEKVLKDGDVTDGSLEELLGHSVFFDDKKSGLHKAVYYVDGKAYETQIDDIVYRGLSNWKPSDTWKMLDNDIVKTADKALTKWNTVHKALITTYHGFFALRNGVRDLGDALWYAESGTDFVKNMPGAVKSMEKRDVYWQLWKASGGKYSGLHDITQALKPESTLKKLGKLRWIEAVNDAIEQYPRFVEFKSVLRKEMESAGITDPAKCTKEMIDKASHAGADITCNFGRVGSLTKPLNRTAVPFLNASIQGADKLWRVISGQKGARGYINLLTKLTAIGVAPGVAMEIMYANDPSFQDLNARDKDSYIFIKDDAGAFWAIPRPRGASTISAPFQQLARQGLGNGDFSFDEFKQKVLNDLAPVSPFDANIFSQMINTFRGGEDGIGFDSPGKTWYGGNIETRADSELPPIMRYNAKTTTFGKKASESIYKVLEKYGGKKIAEKYTLSPKKIDYLMDSYTGIIGDIGKSVTVMGSTKAWYHQLFDQNMKKDPVYSNHLSQDYYDKSDDLNKYCNDDGSPKKGAAIEQSARGQMFKNNNIALSNLRELQNSIRMDKDMSHVEKAKYDKELQIQINSIYRNGVNKKAIKAYDDFIKKHKDQYMSNEKLIKAAQQAYEKETHATVSAMDTIYKIGGLDEVIKHSSSYEDKSGDKNRLTFSKEKTIKQILKKYRKNGGKDDDFYSVYKEMTQANKERGIGTNSAYGNLAAITIRTSGKNPETKGTLRDAFGVSEESRQIVNEYFKLGGSKKEYLAAAEAAEATSNSVRPKNGNKYNYFAPFKARGIADRNLPDRAYRVVDSAESGRRTEYYINNSRGLKHYNISAKTLQEIDNKSAKNEKGYSTSEGLQKVLDKTEYNKEEKALIWEALYGYSYSTSNPYGEIGDYSLKTDVGIDISSGYRRYGNSRYRRYGRYGRRGYRRSGHRSGGGSGGSGSTQTWEKYLAAIDKEAQSQIVKTETPKPTENVKLPEVNYTTSRPKYKVTSAKLKEFNSKATAEQRALVKLLLKQQKQGYKH